jgi:glycosyltransferase involved in cell wall biosynthesis
MQKYKVTVLMPVFNTPVDQISEAVESVLRQKFTDFELLIVDDGSTEAGLLDYYEKIKNVRIRIVRKPENSGIAKTLNYGLTLCNTALVARMDSDDIARDTWLGTMVEFMDTHPEAAICGCQIQPFGIYNTPTNHPQVITKDLILRKNIEWFLNHPGVIYKKDVVLSVKGYDEDIIYRGEDYACWMKLLKAAYTIFNVSQILMDYRVTHFYNKPKEDLAIRDRYKSMLAEKEPVICCMATFPGRAFALQEVVASLLPQCDELHIYLNHYETVPDFLKHNKITTYLSKDHYGDLGAVGKFFPLFEFSKTGYIFTVDDDIIYPASYVRDTIAAIDRYQRQCVVTYHGRIFNLDRKIETYYRDYKYCVDYKSTQTRDTELHTGGTGVMAFHSSLINISLSDFKKTNMADLFFSAYCLNNNIRITGLKHSTGYFTDSNRFDKNNSISYLYHMNDEYQTRFANSLNFKPIKSFNHD